MKPSDYFKRQCWISFDPDESLLKATAEHPLVGADRIIWASDYPHPDAKIPGVVDELREAMTGTQRGRSRRASSASTRSSSTNCRPCEGRDSRLVDFEGDCPARSLIDERAPVTGSRARA